MGIMMIAGTECRRQGCSLQDGKQWVICSNQKMVYPIPFTEVLAFSKTNEHYYMDENVAFTREVSIQSIGTDSMSCYRYGTKTSVILIGV